MFELFCINAMTYYADLAGVEHKVVKNLKGDWYFEMGQVSFLLIKIMGYQFICYNTIEYWEYKLTDLCDCVMRNIF